MSNATITFDMTDEAASRAAREAWIAYGRKVFTVSTVVLVAVVTVIFALAIIRRAHWLWLAFTGLAPVLFALMIVIWLTFLFYAPRLARQKLAHLPHRRVDIVLDDAQIVAQTATERLAVNWSEVKELRDLPSFWLICLKGGSDLPLPKNAVSPEALAMLQRR